MRILKLVLTRFVRRNNPRTTRDCILLRKRMCILNVRRMIHSTYPTLPSVRCPLVCVQPRLLECLDDILNPALDLGRGGSVLERRMASIGTSRRCILNVRQCYPLIPRRRSTIVQAALGANKQKVEHGQGHSLLAESTARDEPVTKVMGPKRGQRDKDGHRKEPH